jgi:hypothetical protein
MFGSRSPTKRILTTSSREVGFALPNAHAYFSAATLNSDSSVYFPPKL